MGSILTALKRAKFLYVKEFNNGMNFNSISGMLQILIKYEPLSECRFYLKHAELQQYAGKVVRPDLAYNFLVLQKIKGCGAELHTLSRGQKTAYIPLLSTGYL